jgi:dolichyl-phosphate-mannose-protein mannosyltransferase
MLTKPRPHAEARLRTDTAQLEPTTAIQDAAPDGQASGVYLPEESRPERYIAIGLFLLSFLYLCLFRRFTGICPDEGIVLQGAQRILDGQVLYRDFFSFFTPGSYYFDALLLRIFGDSFLVARTALAFMGAAFGVITYLLARRVCSREIALLVTGLMTITALPFRFMVLHNWDSTLLTCLALYCAVRWLESPHPKWALATGSLVSLTGLFEQSKGAGLLLGLGLGFLIITFGDRQRKLFARGQMFALAIGLTWPLVVTVIYFASQHALTPMLAGWFWPLQHYSAANRLPYGYQNLFSDEELLTSFFSGSWGMRAAKMLAMSSTLWIPVLPLLGVALLPRLVVGIRRGRSVGPKWAYYVLVSSAVAGLLLSIVLVRADVHHFIYLQPVFFLLLAWLLGGRNVRGPVVRRVGPVLGFCAAFSLLAMAMVLLLGAVGPHYTLVTRRGVVHTQERDTVIEQIQAHVAPGERILAYPYASLIYYMTGTYSPTSFEYYQPGMHTREQAMDMLSQLKAHPVRVVLYEPSFAEHIRDSWPNTPARDVASDPVADYIAHEYRRCASADTPANFYFLFMVRKDLACP